MLAACGATDDAVGDAPESVPSGSVPVADVPVGGGVVVDATETVITQPNAGEFFAFSSICTHQGCSVSRVTADHIICPCHSSQYDTRTGEPVAGPAPRALTPRTVTVTETEVEYS